MPYLMIQTNCVIDEDSRGEVVARASELVAELLAKPERYVMVALSSAVAMRFAGSEAPTVYMELKSIGLPGPAAADLSRSLCAFAHREFNVPPDRVYIEFTDAPRHLWGWNGATF